MQGVAMVVGVARRVVERVPPARQAEQVQEQLVEPPGPEHGAVAQLMDRGAGKKAAERPVDEQRDGERQPRLLLPEGET